MTTSPLNDTTSTTYAMVGLGEAEESMDLGHFHQCYLTDDMLTEMSGGLFLRSVYEHNEVVLAVAVAVTSCVVLAFTLVSCMYFRKWKYRKRCETDAAFYMNAGFDAFPQGPAELVATKKWKPTSIPEDFAINGTTLYGILDLPPHPASDLSKTYPTPYQIDPHGYVEQNLHVSRSPQQVKNIGDIPDNLSPSKHSSSNSLNSKTSTLRDCDRVKSDGFTYSNPGANITQGVEVAIADGAQSGYETIDLGNSPERRDSFILANPGTTKENV